jgi:hypothetical protein
MKKIPISNFRKKFDDKSFQVVKSTINKGYEQSPRTNCMINIAKIAEEIQDADVRKKFRSWACGYDFAVLDV